MAKKKRKPTKKDKPEKRFSSMWDKKRKLKFGNNLVSPKWDLHKHGISYSMISRFLECRERFRLANVEAWTETALNVPLEFGNIFHEALEAQARGKSWERAIDNYMRIHAKNYDHDEQSALALVCGIVYETYPRYMEFWNADKEKEYVYREQEFAVYRTLPSGRKIKLVGKMDAAYYLPSRGGKKELWLQENKTKGQVDMYMIQNTLNQDLQTMIYSYALAHLKGPVSGVLYNVIRRAQLRIRVNESHKDFIARVGDDIEKRPDFYFIRWSTPITPQDVEAFLTRQLDPILEAIYDWWESIKHNPFDPWVNASGGVNLLHYQRPFGVYDPMGVRGSGSFFQMLTQGSYAGLEQRENPFAELTEANTPKEV